MYISNARSHIVVGYNPFDHENFIKICSLQVDRNGFRLLHEQILYLLFYTGRANHWSALIGASHSKNYMLWEYGSYASDGVRQVAEFGSPIKMEEEIRQKVGLTLNIACLSVKCLEISVRLIAG